MATETMLALRQALFTLLEQDSVLNQLAAGIYAHRGETIAHPAVLLGTMEANDWARLNSKGAEITFRVEVRTREQESTRCTQLLARVQTLLNRANLIVEGHTLHYLRWQETRLNEETLNNRFTGTARFTARLIEV